MISGLFSSNTKDTSKPAEVIHKGRVINYTPQKLARLFSYHAPYATERRQLGEYTEIRFKMPKGDRVYLIR